MTSFSSRPQGNTLVLFDVDGTLTPARQGVSVEMVKTLAALRQVAVIGFVGGSDLVKIKEQLEVGGINVMDTYDYCFAENGLTAFKQGKELESQSFIKWLGEDKYKKLVNFCLREMSEIDCPVKRGTFVEFRNGMINISLSDVTPRLYFPILTTSDTSLTVAVDSIQERHDFEKFDKVHNVRRTFVDKLKKEFGDYGLTFSIGGQISFDVFPAGWDKTYALKHVEKEGFKEIHFFGDKTYQGGNDYEIYEDSRTIGHAVTTPEDTIKILREHFKLS